MEIVFLLIGAAISAVIGIGIGDLNGKGNGPTGGLLGALLGPIGWIIVAVLPPAVKKEDGTAVTKETDAQRIERLEKALANVTAAKPTAEPKSVFRAKDDLAGDGEVPTFKL